MQEISNKKFFKNYAFFILILLVIFSVLLYFIYAARKSWTKNLAVTVQTVLDETESGRWKVGNNITVSKPVTVNCCAYELNDKKSKDEQAVIIIRVLSYYGPISAVYIYNNNDSKAEFIGYSSLHGRIKNQLMSNKSDKRREYWQEKIPEILKNRTNK